MAVLRFAFPRRPACAGICCYGQGNGKVNKQESYGKSARSLTLWPLMCIVVPHFFNDFTIS